MGHWSAPEERKKNTTADKSDSDNKRNPVALLLRTKRLPVGLAIGI